jgi:anti-sigma regulatory factor (Ser/Thr protein kinase)
LSCDEFFVIAAMFESELPPGLDAPGVSRRLVADWLAPVLTESALATSRLLVSEIVTNAVRHGRGTITLRAWLFEDRLLVAVIDEGGGFEPEARERDTKQRGPGGWGLRIVDAESSRWGIYPGAAHVWFELERSALRLGPAGSDPAGCG